MFGLLDYLKIGGGLIVGATIAYSPAYLHGKGAGLSEAATASLSKSVEVLRERNAIDEEVTSSSAYAMCAAMGLPDGETAECMRRVQAASSEP